MKAVIIEGSKEEVLSAIDALSQTTIVKPKLKPTLEERTKVWREALAQSKPSKPKIKKKRGWVKWSAKEESLVKDFYKEGDGKRSSKDIKRLARVLGRTPSAIMTRASEHGFTKRTKKVASVVFPDLKMVKTPKEITLSVLKEFVKRNGAIMEFTKDGYFFGIDDLKGWNEFTYELVRNSEAICSFFGVRGKLIAGGLGPSKIIEYRE